MPQFSSGFMKCSFQKHFESVSMAAWKIFMKFREELEFFQKLLKCSSWQSEWIFHQPVDFFPAQAPKKSSKSKTFLVKKPKTVDNSNFLAKSFFGQAKCCFDKARECFLLQTTHLFAQNPKIYYSISQKNVKYFERFSQIFMWLFRMQLWKPFRNHFAQNPEI